MSWRAGQRIDDAALNLRGTQYVIKPSSTDRSSTVTPTNDPDLSLSLDPGLWEIEIGIYYSSATAAAGIRTIWTTPADASLVSLRACSGPGSVSTDRLSTQARLIGQVASGEVTYGHGNGLGNAAGATESALVRIVTAGSVALAWAQRTSDVGATRLHAGAWMRAEWIEE
ncbi:hypothetical protein [Glycomyces tarimensis]